MKRIQTIATCVFSIRWSFCRPAQSRLKSTTAYMAFTIACMSGAGCGSFDPAKSEVSSVTAPVDEPYTNRKIPDVDWRAVLDRAISEYAIGSDQPANNMDRVAYRARGSVVRSSSVSAGLSVNIVDWIRGPGLNRIGDVWAFSLLKAKHGWIIVYFDVHGRQLSVSGALSADATQPDAFAVTWTLDQAGSGGEGQNYARTHTIYRISENRSGELIVESDQHYELRELGGLYWKRGNLISIASFPRI